MAKANIFVRDLTNEEEEQLLLIIRKRNIDFSYKQRAQIIMKSSVGNDVKSISKQLKIAPSTVIRWIKRFNSGGFDSLKDLKKSTQINKEENK